MITRTSQPASGAMPISEMKEFASFPKATAGTLLLLVSCCLRLHVTSSMLAA